MSDLISGARVMFIDRSHSDNLERSGRVVSQYLWPVYDSKSPCTWYLIVDSNGKAYHVQPMDVIRITDDFLFVK